MIVGEHIPITLPVLSLLNILLSRISTCTSFHTPILLPMPPPFSSTLHLTPLFQPHRPHLHKTLQLGQSLGLLGTNHASASSAERTPGSRIIIHVRMPVSSTRSFSCLTM